MGTTVKVMLNDEKAITELAKDPEVQLRIKDAIADAIVKRAVKTLHDGIMAEVNAAIGKVLEDIRTQKDKTLSDIFAKGDWRGASLTDTYRAYIRSEARSAMRMEVCKIVDEQMEELGKEYIELCKKRKAEIESYDFDKAVKDYVSKRVSGVVAKLIQ